MKQLQPKQQQQQLKLQQFQEQPQQQQKQFQQCIGRALHPRGAAGDDTGAITSPSLPTKRK
jgi:hypothetical protein